MTDISLKKWLKLNRDILNITGLERVANIPVKTIDYFLREEGARDINKIQKVKLISHLNKTVVNYKIVDHD